MECRSARLIAGSFAVISGLRGRQSQLILVEKVVEFRSDQFQMQVATHSLHPLFMVGTLGASALAVGLIEGLAESTALIVKIFSGALGDYLGKRKGLALFGYALGALTKPLLAAANTTGIVLTARLLDRVGKRVRGRPVTR